MTKREFSAWQMMTEIVGMLGELAARETATMRAHKKGTPAYEEAKGASAVYAALSTNFRQRYLADCQALDVRHAETRAERDVYREQVDRLEGLLMELGRLMLATAQGDVSATQRTAQIMAPYVMMAMPSDDSGSIQ